MLIFGGGGSAAGPGPSLSSRADLTTQHCSPASPADTFEAGDYEGALQVQPAPCSTRTTNCSVKHLSTPGESAPCYQLLYLYGLCSNKLRLQPSQQRGPSQCNKPPQGCTCLSELGCHPAPAALTHFWTGLTTGRAEVLCWPLCTRAGEQITEPWETLTPKICPYRLSCAFIVLLTWGHLPGLGREHLGAHPEISMWDSQTQRWAAARGSPSRYTSVWRCPRLWGIQSFPSKPHSYL